MIKKSTLAKVFLGSFFIQASWNFEKMQGLGFAAAISPALDDIYGGDESARREARKRHLAMYNAHPYMASPVLGATVRLEEEVASGTVAPERAEGFKRKVMGVYGALGDGFFWNAVRPLASIIGVLATIVWGVWGPVVFLVAYNAFHLWMRYTGLTKGYSLGEGVVSYINGLRLLVWARRLRLAASAALGAAAAVMTASMVSTFLVPMGPRMWGFDTVFPAAVAVVAVSSAAVAFLLGRKARVLWLVYAMVPVWLIATALA